LAEILVTDLEIRRREKGKEKEQAGPVPPGIF
jgi:hypothetical protein